MRLRRSVVVLIPLFFLMSGYLPAAQDDAVVVTATRVPKRFAELVNDVTVVGREELDRAAGASLPTILQRIPGVEISSNGGYGSTAQVFMRGSNSAHTLVLVDGMRVGSATAGATAIELIPLEQIERIEVLRGPASSLYGSDAIGGVIQIFTRSGRGNPGLNGYAQYGSQSFMQAGGGYGREEGGTRFSVQASATSTDGISTLRNPAAFGFNPDADAFSNVNATGQLAAKYGTGHEAGLRLFHTEGRKHFDSFPAAFDHRLTQSLSAASAYTSNRLTDSWRSNLTVGKGTDDLTSVSSPTTQDVFRTDLDQATWQNDFTTPLGLVIGALEYLGEQVGGTTSYPVKERTVKSALAGYQGSFGPHQLQASLRRDDNTQFGVENTWQLGYGHRFNAAFRAWANAGTAFKAPTFNQLYFPGFGNPNLKPERSRGSEIGVEYGSAIRTSAVYYRNKVENLIVNVGFPLAAPFNVDKATLRGWTLGAAGEVRGATFTASLDLQDPENDATGRLLPRRARQHMSAAVGIPAMGGRAVAEVLASSHRYDDPGNTLRMGGYGLLNLAYERPAAKQWKLIARVNNVADKRYELVRDFNTPGRTLFVGVRYEERGY